MFVDLMKNNLIKVCCSEMTMRLGKTFEPASRCRKEINKSIDGYFPQNSVCSTCAAIEIVFCERKASSQTNKLLFNDKKFNIKNLNVDEPRKKQFLCTQGFIQSVFLCLILSYCQFSFDDIYVRTTVETETAARKKRFFYSFAFC